MVEGPTLQQDREVAGRGPLDAPEITDLLRQWNDGQPSALEQLMPLVYGELRDLARAHLYRESPRHTLQPTALVNEVYVRLVERQKVSWDCRSQFFGCAAQLMRRILVDHARAKKTAKRSSGVLVDLEEAGSLAKPRDVDLVALDDALNDLTRMSPRQSRVVELRYFAGLTIEETAATLQVGTATVIRDWSLAKAWLYRELKR